MSSDTLPVQCYGKLPTYGDFVRFNAAGEVMQDLDSWLQKGLLQASSKNLDESDLSSAPVYRFVYRPPGKNTSLAGVMRPSRDQSGRRFPFIIGVEKEQEIPDVRDAIRIPVRFKAFLDRAERLVRTATAGQVDHRTVMEQLSADGRLPAESPGSDDRYRQYLTDTSFRNFVEQIWDHFEDSRKYIVFRNLLDIVLPLRGVSPVRLSFGLRFPLSIRAPDPSLAATTWLDMCVRLLEVMDVSLSFFWSSPDSENETPYMFLYLQPPPPSAYLSLVQPEVEVDSLYDLERTGHLSAVEAALSIPPHYAGALESEFISLGAFLDHIGPPLSRNREISQVT